MANVVINGNTYNAVPSVQIPKQGGGTAVFFDTSDATATAAHVASGYTAYNENGKISGQLTVPTISQDSTTKVLIIS